VAITFDGLELPDMLMEPDPDLIAGVEASVEMTLGLRPVVWEGARVGGKPIDLVAYRDQGWGPTASCPAGLSRAVVAALKAKAATAGWSGILSYEGRTLRVRFRHEEPPAIEMEPLRPRPNAAGDDYYFGRIKLMEV
jgi:hypothetical protein